MRDIDPLDPGQVHDLDSFLAFVQALTDNCVDEGEEERSHQSSLWGRWRGGPAGR